MKAFFEHIYNPPQQKSYTIKALLGKENYSIVSGCIDRINVLEENENNSEAAELRILTASFILKHSNLADRDSRNYLLKDHVLTKFASGHLYYYRKATSGEDQLSIEEFRKILIISIRYAALNLEAGNRENWYSSNLGYIKDICAALAKQHSSNTASCLMFELLEQPDISVFDLNLQMDLFKLAQSYAVATEHYAGKPQTSSKASTLRRRKINQ